MPPIACRDAPVACGIPCTSIGKPDLRIGIVGSGGADREAFAEVRRCPPNGNPAERTLAAIRDGPDRVVAGDNTVRYKNRTLQIPADRHRHHYVKAQVRVHEYPDGHLAVFHGPRCLARYRAHGETIDDDRLQAA